MESLQQAERVLRRYDKALRLREDGLVLRIERKTFRGRIGANRTDGGGPWPREIGRRYEEGHVPVGTVSREDLDSRLILQELQAVDTWRRWDRNARPLSVEAEEAESRKRSQQVRTRRDGLLHKAGDLFDRYVWKEKQRVFGGL